MSEVIEILEKMDKDERKLMASSILADNALKVLDAQELIIMIKNYIEKYPIFKKYLADDANKVIKILEAIITAQKKNVEGIEKFLD